MSRLQAVMPVRKNSTNIHADAASASDENHRGDRRVTKPAMMAKRDSSRPRPSILKSRGAGSFTNSTYARAPQAHNADAVASKTASVLVIRPPSVRQCDPRPTHAKTVATNGAPYKIQPIANRI